MIMWWGVGDGDECDSVTNKFPDGNFSRPRLAVLALPFRQTNTSLRHSSPSAPMQIGATRIVVCFPPLGENQTTMGGEGLPRASDARSWALRTRTATGSSTRALRVPLQLTVLNNPPTVDNLRQWAVRDSNPRRQLSRLVYSQV